MDVDKALATQLQNIQTRTGKTLDELCALVRGSGLQKHGQIRDFLKAELGLGHGDANSLTHYALQTGGTGALAAAQAGGAAAKPDLAGVLDGIYSGAKSALRPVHDRLMAEIDTWGDFETAPKKDYVSLRRKKQFAMIGPATNTRVEVGLNLKDAPTADRLNVQPPKGMCSHKVKLTTADEVDAELLGWIRQAYEGAG